MKRITSSWMLLALKDWVQFTIAVIIICFIYALMLVGCTDANPYQVIPPPAPVADLSTDMPDMRGDVAPDLTPASCMVPGKNTCNLNDMSIICRMSNGVLGICDCQLTTGCCCL